jgi:hypothetical protein
LLQTFFCCFWSQFFSAELITLCLLHHDGSLDADLISAACWPSFHKLL